MSSRRHRMVTGVLCAGFLVALHRLCTSQLTTFFSSLTAPIHLSVSSTENPIHPFHCILLNDFSAVNECKLNRTIRGRMAKFSSCTERHVKRMDQLVPNTENTSLVTVILEGRLGNHIFQVASLLGIASHTHRIPYITSRSSDSRKHYFEIFNNFSIPFNPSEQFFQRLHHNSTNVARIDEDAAGVFRRELYDLPEAIITSDQTVVIGGYLQSFKYFKDIKEDVQCLLTFREDIYLKAKNVLVKELKLKFEGKFFHETPALIGIQVRRGDFTSMPSTDGRIPAPDDYFTRAIGEMERHYANRSLVFVVVSDDFQYCGELFRGDENVLVLQTNAQELDLALLQLMDSVIISVGTYGFWGAYSGNPERVVYFKNWPKNGTVMRKKYRNEDYFPPDWTGLSGCSYVFFYQINFCKISSSTK